MPLDKRRRTAFAGAFLTATLAGVNAVKDVKEFWPLNALWQQLRGSQRFQLVGGCALAIVMLVLFFKARGERSVET